MDICQTSVECPSPPGRRVEKHPRMSRRKSEKPGARTTPAHHAHDRTSQPTQTRPQPASLRPGFGLKESEPGQFELTHPPCVEARRPQFDQAMRLVQTGARDQARALLRAALEGCGDNLWIHATLGKLALEAGDLTLARGHLGYAFERVRALIANLAPGSLPRSLHGNVPFFQALDALADCYKYLGRPTQQHELKHLAAYLGDNPASVRSPTREL